MLELYEAKVSCTVLRGERRSNPPDLPDRLYNVGFAIFTLGFILLYLTPDIGEAGAIEIIVFRLVKTVLMRYHSQ